MEKQVEKKKKEGAEGEKIVRNYKGDVAEIASLEGKSGLPCEASETLIKSFKGKWGQAPEAKLPKLFILISVGGAPYGPESRYLTCASYLGKWRTVGVYVPSDFKVKVLTGRQGVAITEGYTDHQLNQNMAGALAHNWVIGCDGLVFAEDEKGIIIPATTYLGDRSKAAKHSGGNTIYHEGYGASFNTKAGGCLGYLSDSIQLGLKSVYQKLIKVNPAARLSTKSAIEIPLDMLKKDIDGALDHDKIPVMNVYGLSPKVTAPKDQPFRVSSFDFHYGIGHKNPEQISEIVKALDSILAVGCVSLFGKLDNPVFREVKLPGSYRLPAHGIEYCGLPISVLAHPAIMNLVFDLSRKVVRFGEGGFRKYWKADESEVIDIICKGDVERARKLLEANKSIMSKLFKAAGYADTETPFKVFMNGIESAVKKPDDIVGNWHLDGTWAAHCNGSRSGWQVNAPTIKGGKKI